MLRSASNVRGALGMLMISFMVSVFGPWTGVIVEWVMIVCLFWFRNWMSDGSMCSIFFFFSVRLGRDVIKGAGCAVGDPCQRCWDFVSGCWSDSPGPAFKLAWENVRSQYVRLRESHDSAKRSFLQRWNREEKMLASAEQSVIDFLTTVLEIGGGSLDLPPVYPEDPEGLPDPEDGDDV